MKLPKIPYKGVLIGSVLIGIGLGSGSVATLFILSNNHPTIIREDKWKIVTTETVNPPIVGHTSLNPDELTTLLKIQGQPGIAGITTSTTVPPVSSTTQKSLPVPSTTATTQSPSTLPPSSTTSTNETTTIEEPIINDR